MTQDDAGSAPMLGSQPVAWAVAIGDKGRVLDGIFISKAKADEVLEWRNENTEYGARLIPLYEHPKPTLTGDEREALGDVIDELRHQDNPNDQWVAARLQELLDRLG